MKTTDLNKGKIFAVRYSGHGSDFLPKNPLFNLTFEEAKKNALEWELRADTIGGRAEIVTALDFIINQEKTIDYGTRK
jgi:hypothetical protein